MLSVFKSDRFKKEFEEYKKVAEELENSTVKNELELLIKQLVAEVQKIDIGHTNIIQKNEVTSNLGEARTKIAEVRKRIHRIVEDHKNAVK